MAAHMKMETTMTLAAALKHSVATKGKLLGLHPTTSSGEVSTAAERGWEVMFA